jgi:hypothetical protein
MRNTISQEDAVPLTIRVHEGKHRPVFVCDHCNKVIESARDGNMMWRFDSPDQTEASAVAFTHKACCHAFEHTGSDRVFWMAAELSHSMVYLANNLEMDEKAWKQAEEGARMLAQI